MKRIIFILFLFVSVSSIGQTKRIVVFTKLNHYPIANITVYSIEGNILSVSNKYGEIYFFNSVQIPDSVYLSKDNICDTLITNLSKIDTIFIQYPCYELDVVNIKATKLGLKKYWKRVHNDSINKEIGIGDTVLFYQMNHDIFFPDKNMRFVIKGIIEVSVERRKAHIIINKIDFYCESVDGDSNIAGEDFFEIFPRFPLEDYFSYYTNLLLEDNIAKGIKEKYIKMELGQESKKEFRISSSNVRDEKYLYNGGNEFLTFLRYTSDSTIIGYGYTNYSSVLVNYSVDSPRFMKELSTVLCSNIPNKKITGDFSGNIFIVKMHLNVVDKPVFNTKPIEWGKGYSTYIELLKEIKKQKSN